MGAGRNDTVQSNSPSSELGTLRLRDVTYRPGRVQHRHRHRESTLSLVVAGELEETSAAVTYRAGAGSLVVKPADHWHANFYGPRGARIVQIGPSDEGDILWSGFHWSYQWHEAPRLARSIIALLGGRRTADAAELDLWEALEGLSARGETRARRTPLWWAEAVDLLNACTHEPLSVSVVARRLGVHPVHLARVCRREFGCTVRQYIRRRRVLAAWRAWERGEAPLAAIAARAGFADQAHMTRAFREVLGVSPGRLRRWAVSRARFAL